MTDTLFVIYYIIAAMGLFVGFYLNNKIYEDLWFKRFIPISLLLILSGLLAKFIFDFLFYKLLIIPVIFIYLIKFTQFCYKFFGVKYNINIRGFEDRDSGGMPTMDSLISIFLMAIYAILYLILK